MTTFFSTKSTKLIKVLGIVMFAMTMAGLFFPSNAISFLGGTLELYFAFFMIALGASAIIVFRYTNAENKANALSEGFVFAGFASASLIAFNSDNLNLIIWLAPFVAALCIGILAFVYRAKSL